MARLAGARGGGEVVWTEVDEATATTILRTPVPTIGGLPVLRYDASWFNGHRAVRVRQAVELGTVVELIATTTDAAATPVADKKDAGAAIEAFEAQADSLNSVVVRRANLTVRIVAALSTDSLRVLAERIRPSS
jgi:hypothetical protein